MEINRRIYAARTEAGMTQLELAEAIGKTRGAVAQWESGDVRPRHTTLVLVAKATGKSLKWLESGVDETHTGMRVVGEVAAGFWREATAMLNTYNVPVTPHPSYPAESQRLYKIAGNSLNRIAPDGAYIHCVALHGSQTIPVSGDLVVVRRMRGGAAEYTAKRYLVNDGKRILRPESTDPAFQEDLVINGDDSVTIEITDIVIATWAPIPRGIP